MNPLQSAGIALAAIAAVVLGTLSGTAIEHVHAMYLGDAFDAARLGYLDRARELTGGDAGLVRARDGRRRGLLHITTDPGTVRELIAAGADANLEDSNGETPLSVVMDKQLDSYGSDEVIEELLKGGADPKQAVDRYGTTLLIRCWRKWHPIMAKQRLAISRLLLQYGDNPLAQEPGTGRTVLHNLLLTAPFHAKGVTLSTVLEALQLFIEHSPKIVKIRDSEGRTPLALMTSVASPFAQSIESIGPLTDYLLSAGSSVVQPDKHAVNPLCYASFKAVRLLLRHFVNHLRQLHTLSNKALGERFLQDAVMCAMASPAPERIAGDDQLLDDLVGMGCRVDTAHLCFFLRVHGSGMQNSTAEGRRLGCSAESPDTAQNYLAEQAAAYVAHHRISSRLIESAWSSLLATAGRECRNC